MSAHGGGRTPSAILFDLDGTLIDTWHLYRESYARALELHLGRRLTLEDVGGRPPASERKFLVELLGPERGAACHADVVRLYAELHGSLAEGPYDGVREMLAALRAAGYPLGIVTGKGREGWKLTEREVALGPFDVVVTDDDVAAPKPDPEGLLSAARALGLPPSEILYVGDSAGDLHAGRNAGTRIAAVLWPKTGEGERERFLKSVEDHAPDWVFAHPADLTRAFAAWC